jgi:hypothetical protein
MTRVILLQNTNRNKLRLEVIPIIEQINPQFCITLKENTAIFADIADIV